MSIITSCTRAWLTRSFRSFVFTDEYDEALPYDACEKLGLYIHIPFCKRICSFCPYCKELYSAEKCNRYIDFLLREIRLVGRTMPEKKRVTSVYFGGGTPALAADRIGEIIAVLGESFTVTEGIGVELHPDNVTEETLLKLKSAGVTKISVGVQSFSDKFLNVLGRRRLDVQKMRDSLLKVPFETVSMDFIFALPEQTAHDMQEDIEKAFSIGANHIAMYPFIDFSFTDKNIPAMKKREKRALLDEITLYCESRGYMRDSIWTFSKQKNARYSSMTRENFLGFGCSAVTLLNDRFKINTFSVEGYEKRIEENKLPTSLTLRFTRRQRMVYYLFWTAYSTKVRADDFEKFFGTPLKKEYGFELRLAEKLGFITESEGTYSMTAKGAFYYHYYEQYYTLAYIDKMWDVMRRTAFPKKLKL